MEVPSCQTGPHIALFRREVPVGVSGQDRRITAYFDGLSDSPFTVSALQPGAGQVNVDAGISGTIGTRGKVFVGYQGTFRNGITAHGVTGGVSLAF